MPATDTIILALSVTDMLQTLTWPTLQQRRLKTKLIMFYKIVHHIVAVPTTILIPTDPRIRQFHPFTYRHLHALKDPHNHSLEFTTSNYTSSSSSSNLGTGFTRECIRFRENFAQCRATQQPSTDYLQVKLYSGGSWSICCQDAP